MPSRRPTVGASLRLLLLRHAKAERAEPGARDHERALTARGRNDATRIGAYLAGHKLIPDLALVSTSTRTRETWRLAAQAFSASVPVKYDERIYNGGPADILQSIRNTDSALRSLLVVGHNPGLHELAVLLTAAGEIDLRQRLKEEFPTAALAVIDFALSPWSRLHANAGRLEGFVTPRSLTPAAD